MAKTGIYQVHIQWFEEREDSEFVEMTKRQLEFMTRQLKRAQDDEKIQNYDIVSVDSNVMKYETMVEWMRNTGTLQPYFGPREWMPEGGKEEKPWPFIEISNRTLICSHCPDEERLQYPANKGGAQDLGEALKERKIKRWLYSSSVDFPKEYGAPNIDFRSIIEEAAGMDPSENRPW